MRHDARGIPVSSGSTGAIARYETAIGQLQSYVGDPIATIDGALAESPDFVAGHLMKALTLATLAERQYARAIAQSIAAARDHGARANARELGLLQAAAQVADGGDAHRGERFAGGLADTGELAHGQRGEWRSAPRRVARAARQTPTSPCG